MSETKAQSLADLLPDARWGTAETPLPPVVDDGADDDPDDEELPETPPDVIAILGFDPLDLTDDDAEAGEDATPPFAADADWKEDEHTRGQPGNAGQFGSGGGGKNTAAHAKTLPAPSAYGGVPIKKQAQAIAAEHLTKGSHHDAAAQAIKDFAAQHEHPSVANYANKLLEHVAMAHGVHPNALGKAYPKAAGSKTSAAPPAAAPALPQAPSDPAPSSGPKIPEGQEGKASVKQVQKIGLGSGSNSEKIAAIKALMENDSVSSAGQEHGAKWIKHLEGQAQGQTSPSAPPAPAPKLNPVGPKPHPDSPNQQKIWQMADAPGTPADKIEQIKTLMPTLPPGGLSETFAKEWITALGGDPDTPAAKPATQTPGSLGAGESHTAAVRGASARADKAEKLAQAAQKVATTHSAAARKIAPSLSPAYWAGIPEAVKQSIKDYGDGKYSSINNALRGDTPNVSKDAAAHIENIDSLFDHDEAISTDAVILMRGENTPTAVLDQWKATLKDGWPPCIYTRTGYTSASMAHEPAFASKPVWFHFTAPKGTRMVGLAGHVGHHENEMLLQHGQSMEVYEIYESGGKTHVKATLK